MHGRGTFVKATHIKDSIGILIGGLTGEHAYSPLSMTCLDHARGYLTRLGFDARVYTENPLTASRLPAALLEELDAGKIKGLMTVLSGFSYRHLGTDAWRRHRVPHVDIGSQPAPQRVFIDFDAFFKRALALAGSEGRARPLLIASGSGIPGAEIRRRVEGTGATVYTPPPELAQSTGKEEWGFRLMLDLIRRKADFDCLVVPEDGIAKGLCEGVLAGGLPVARRPLIVSLVNRGVDLFYPIPIIKLEVNVEALMIHAADRLLRLLQEPDLPPEAVLIPPDREIRACDPVLWPKTGEAG
jgi:DNA-binding LacI/PurR family transcriptional regulator